MAAGDGIAAYPLLSNASSLIGQGQFEQAAQRIIAHLRAHPDEPRGLALLGETATHLGALVQAEQFLRRALAVGDGAIDVRRQLAAVLNQQERLPEALALFETLSLETNDPSLDAIRSIVLDKLGQNERALELRQSLIDRFPQNPLYWIPYGNSLRTLGKVDEAIEAYRRCVALDEELGEGWWGLAGIKRPVLTDHDLERMRAAADIAADIRNVAPLQFSIARALHDRGRFEEAFTHYAQANRLRAESLAYDRRELTAEVDEIVRDFGSAHFPLPDHGDDDVVPIFIVSLPRSGSTLLEQMLGSHPSIEPVGELPYIPAILRSAMEIATRRGPVTVPQLVNGLPDGAAMAMGRDYLRRLAAHRRTDRRFVVDKLPHNWSNIPFVRRILPTARFLDIRRPALDCCFSNFTQSFSSAHASSFALEDIGQSYVDYVRLMDHLDVVAPALVHHIRYERLIEEPEAQLRSALAYCGLPWDPAVLDFHRLDRAVRTPSAEQVRRPLNRDGVDVWRPYDRWLGPLREALGDLAER